MFVLWSRWRWPRSARSTRPLEGSTTGQASWPDATSAVWAWYVGWFNFLGEVAVTAAIDYGAAITWMALLNLVFGLEVSLASTFVAFIVIIVLHGLLNTFGVNLVRMLSDVSAWWHLVGVAVIVGVLWLVPDQHQTLSWTFTEYGTPPGSAIGRRPPTRSCSACSWRSTPTPATTPPPTSPRRP